MPLPAGARLGPYEIVSRLGAGGMGEVYRARDRRLHRDVALKVLPDTIAADEHRRRRFEQEARSIAALNHQNICQIYDVGPNYLVLELVEGRELYGPRPVDEAVGLARQIADGLQAAHAHGILHRDLKPSNVLVSAAGIAKLLDFGIAKLEGPDRDVTLTADGTVLGTVAYMSPEQALGKRVDGRSDIFSFGALLYELVAGRRAFEGETTAQVLSAVLQHNPPAFDGAPSLERIIRRCLEKDPAQRYQTVAELRAALDLLSAAAERPPSIAVLPFENMSGDKENEYFSDGLAEEVINALARVPGLKVIARTSAFAFKGKREDIRRIAEALGVTTVLEGSVRRAGNRLRVTAQLIAAADGTHIWSERYDREMLDVFEIQDFIAASIAEALEVKLSAPHEKQRHTPALPAFEALLRGRHILLRQTPGAHTQARAYLERAMALDSRYAEPHASLGLSLFQESLLGGQSLRETATLIRAEANKALALEPAQRAPHYLLGTVAAAHDYDWHGAQKHFEIALAAGNAPAEAHWAYSSLYFQPLGQFAEAVSHMERAVERDPLNPHWRAVLGSHLVHLGSHLGDNRLYERAIHEANEAIKVDPTHFAGHTISGEAYLAMERWPQAIESFEHGYRLVPSFAMATGCLAGAHLRGGNLARAGELLQELGTSPRAAIGRALYHLIAHELEPAGEWLERAIEYRDPFVLVYAADKIMRPLRETPRWARLAALMNLPP
jgi:TolB-like protein/predicted Ser/Thr protein kinase